jgi:histidine triad (HIT) family protein
VGSRKVYEDDYSLGILDIYPRFAKGQCLVFPKKHVEDIYDLQDEEVIRLFRAVREVAGKIDKLYEPEGIGMFMRGRTFPHIHVLLYPSFPIKDNILGAFFESLRLYGPLARISEDELDDIALKFSQQ